jgi:hypothetical protein
MNSTTFFFRNGTVLLIQYQAVKFDVLLIAFGHYPTTGPEHGLLWDCVFFSLPQPQHADFVDHGLTWMPIFS